MVTVYYFYQNSNDNNTVVKKIETDTSIHIDSLVNENLKQHFFLLPKFDKDQIVKHQLYTLSYNEKHEQANWVAYRLYENSINDAIKRKDNFRSDPKITSGSASVKDYKKSGYDRRHLAPAKAMSFSKETMSESFYMSNMSPQKPSFNRGIWKKLEEKVRSLVTVSDSLYIVTGPVLKDSLSFIGDNRVTVPKAYYKAIIRFKNNELFGVGFLLKNQKSSKELNTFSVSIDSIEKVTGIDFFYKLNIEVQNRVESNFNYSYFIQK